MCEWKTFMGSRSRYRRLESTFQWQLFGHVLQELSLWAQTATDLLGLQQSQRLAWQLQVFHWQEPPCYFPEVLEFHVVRGSMIQVTEFMVVNCIIEFICRLTVIQYIAIWSYLSETKTTPTKLLLWVKICIDGLPLGIIFGKEREHSLPLILGNGKLKPDDLKVVVDYFFFLFAWLCFALLFSMMKRQKSWLVEILAFLC